MQNALDRRAFLVDALWGTTAAALRLGRSAGAGARPPNVVFILADDLGYGDLGCYGQSRILTPHIDGLARAGMRFTQCYAGSTVCAPSRSVLMTGQHAGHTRVRGNFCLTGGFVGHKGQQVVRRMSLTDEDRTVGHVLRAAGYRTGLVGKWHLDAFNPGGGPLDRGFDEFYGWLLQTPETASPVYYPPRRYRNRQLLDVVQNQAGAHGYHDADMCQADAIAFMKAHQGRPFFLLISPNLPHSPIEIPDLGEYESQDWPLPCKTYAAMVSRLDRLVGSIERAVQELGLDKQTIVFFASDNGPRSEPTPALTEIADFFASHGPLRGYKRDLYEGGIRVPMIARWPGHVPAGRLSATPWYFADILATAAALAGVAPPPGTDGVSLVPTLLGRKQDLANRPLYWEFFEQGFQQAVRWGVWKAIRLERARPLSLYDLTRDPGEEHDVAQEHPTVVARIEAFLKTARSESAEWPLELATRP